jgi:hypothetical protein
MLVAAWQSEFPCPVFFTKRPVLLLRAYFVKPHKMVSLFAQLSHEMIVARKTGSSTTSQWVPVWSETEGVCSVTSINKKVFVFNRCDISIF